MQFRFESYTIFRLFAQIRHEFPFRCAFVFQKKRGKNGNNNNNTYRRLPQRISIDIVLDVAISDIMSFI